MRGRNKHSRHYYKSLEKYIGKVPCHLSNRICLEIKLQGIFQLIELFYAALPITKGNDPNFLAVSSSVIGLISLLIGELGCLHNSSSLFFFFFLSFASFNTHSLSFV